METAKRGMLAEEYGLTLAHYMAADKRTEIKPSTERVLATGALVGGRFIPWDAALLEVHARLAKRSSRSRKPARHVVASVHEGEVISPQACGGMAAVLAEELGCKAGIIMWALHGDTDNVHPHFLILTLDENGAATPFGRDGRSYEAMQRAIARIEHHYKLAREPGARYEIIDGKVQRTALAPRPAKVRAPIRPEIIQWETQTGLESFTRYAQDVLAPQLDVAGSWEDAQISLAALGARIVKVGSGGEIRTGDGHHKVKLSKVDRALSWPKLNKRWGEWSNPATEPTPYEPRILDVERARRWVERDAHAEALHNAVQARMDRLKTERKTVISNIKRDHSDRRVDLAGLIGEPVDLARVRQSHEMICRRHIDATKAEYRDRIAALRELRAEIDKTDVLDGVVLDDVAEYERSLSIDWACRPALPGAPPGFVAEPIGQSIQYWRDDEAARIPAFVQRGDRIWINDRSDASIRAALIVAQARYGVVAAHGDAVFIAQAQRLGRELGIEVQNGAITPSPSARARSPRVQQRRDAVRRWETASGQVQEAVPPVDVVPAPGDIAQHPFRQSAAAPAAMSQGERRAILAHVARLLADNDWDPRDYHRTAAGKGRPAGKHAQEVTDPNGQLRRSPASRQAQRDAAGWGR